MRKKFLTMFLVGAMALSITACGGKEAEEASNTPSQPTVEQNVEENVTNDNQQETVVENTDEEVLEGDAPIEEGDGEINDDADRGVETIDLTNTTIYNVAEKFGTTIELPVFTFAYFEETDAYGYYKANNIAEDGTVYETYYLSINCAKKNISPADVSAKLDYYSTDYGSDYEENRYGNVDSNYIVSHFSSSVITNGDILVVKDEYYIYDASTSSIYKIHLEVNKNASLYGEDVMEKSTADYREQFREAVVALANN